MGQNFAAQVGTLATGGTSYLAVDADGRLIVSNTALSSALNITAATELLTVPGEIGKLSVTTGGTSLGAIYDSATISGTTAANLICEIPTVVGVTSLDWPTTRGILVVPGTSQTVSLTFTTL